MSDTIILHHYAASPFAEKVRFALGALGSEWLSCDQPIIAPKPDLQTLTGGYRKIPVLQIGADVWLDTRLILSELSQRLGQSKFSSPQAEMMQFWTDKTLFPLCAAAIFGEIGRAMPASFIEDRKRMMPDHRFDLSAMEKVRPHALGQIAIHLDLLGQLLGEQAFLGGQAPDARDAHAWYNVWFLRRSIPQTTQALFEGRTHLQAWAQACAAISAGHPETVRADDALAAAAAEDPEEIDPNEPVIGRVPPLGTQVMLEADDYGRDPMVGRLVRASAREFAIELVSDEVGRVVVHAPRAGFLVRPA